MPLRRRVPKRPDDEFQARLCVFTDLGPADLLALRVLHRRRVQPKVLVVSGGDVAEKLLWGQWCCMLMEWQDTVVVPGVPSAAVHPWYQGHRDGLELDQLYDVYSPRGQYDFGTKKWRKRLDAIVLLGHTGGTRWEELVFLCLGTELPAELVAARVEDPVAFDDLVTRVNVHLVLGGSGAASAEHWAAFPRVQTVRRRGRGVSCAAGDVSTTTPFDACFRRVLRSAGPAFRLDSTPALVSVLLGTNLAPPAEARRLYVLDSSVAAFGPAGPADPWVS